MNLGRPDKAEAILDESRQLLPGQRKASAIVLGNLAIASIRQRHIDIGAARLHEAIDVVERTRSGGGLNVVFAAARELRPLRNEPVVQDVTDRLLTLMTAAWERIHDGPRHRRSEAGGPPPGLGHPGTQRRRAARGAWPHPRVRRRRPGRRSPGGCLSGGRQRW